MSVTGWALQKLGVDTERVHRIFTKLGEIAGRVWDWISSKVSIWNLARETRKALQQDSVPVLLEAGYRDNTSQLFSGDLRNVTSVHDGPEWVYWRPGLLAGWLWGRWSVRFSW